MRIIYSKMIGFVRFVLRASAEFAKEALADQDIGNGEVLNVRDLVAHYWHSSMYSVVVPCCSRASPTTGIAIGPRTASSFSPCCILLFASFCCCDTRQVRWAQGHEWDAAFTTTTTGDWAVGHGWGRERRDLIRGVPF